MLTTAPLCRPGAEKPPMKRKSIAFTEHRAVYVPAPQHGRFRLLDGVRGGLPLPDAWTLTRWQGGNTSPFFLKLFLLPDWAERLKAANEAKTEETGESFSFSSFSHGAQRCARKDTTWASVSTARPGTREGN